MYIVVYFIICLGGPKTKVRESKTPKVKAVGNHTNVTTTTKSKKRQSSKQK